MNIKVLFIVLSLILLGGCRSPHYTNTAGVIGSGRDFRIMFLSESNMNSLLLREVCLVLRNSPQQEREIPVGKGIPLREVLQRLGSGNYFQDCSLVVVKPDQMLRRSDWYESDKTEQRNAFENIFINSGDLVFIGPVK